MNKNDKLKAIIDEVDDLLALSVTSPSPEFTAWRTKAERFLISEYGKDSYEITEFKKMHFLLVCLLQEHRKVSLLPLVKGNLNVPRQFCLHI